MKYFIVLLAVGAVFAQQPFDTKFKDNQQEADKTFEDKQQDIETQNVEDDVNRRPADISTKFINVNVHVLSEPINRLIDAMVASQPGRF